VKEENRLLEESRFKLLKEYDLDPTAPAEVWNLTKEVDRELGTKWTELLSVQVEIWGDEMSLDELEGMELSAADLETLTWLIREPNESLKLVG
jgi:hypothetical protein